MSGWFIARRQPSDAVWGGIMAAPPAVPAIAVTALMTGDYDSKTWWKKRWILRL